MQVTVLLFGGIKEALGTAQLTIPISSVEPPTLDWLFRELRRVDDRVERLTPGLKLALNESFLDGVGVSAFQSRVLLTNGDVLALIPPVCGG